MILWTSAGGTKWCSFNNLPIAWWFLLLGGLAVSNYLYFESIFQTCFVQYIMLDFLLHQKMRIISTFKLNLICVWPNSLQKDTLAVLIHMRVLPVYSIEIEARCLRHSGALFLGWHQHRLWQCVVCSPLPVYFEVPKVQTYRSWKAEACVQRILDISLWFKYFRCKQESRLHCYWTTPFIIEPGLQKALNFVYTFCWHHGLE